MKNWIYSLIEEDLQKEAGIKEWALIVPLLANIIGWTIQDVEAKPLEAKQQIIKKVNNDAHAEMLRCNIFERAYQFCTFTSQRGLKSPDMTVIEKHLLEYLQDTEPELFILVQTDREFKGAFLQEISSAVTEWVKNVQSK